MKQKRLSSSLLPSALALLLVLGACTQDEGIPAPQGADDGETPRGILQLSGVSLATDDPDATQTRAEQELVQGTLGVGVKPENGYSLLEWGQFTRQAGGTWTGSAIELGHDPISFYMWYSPAGYLTPNTSGQIQLIPHQKYDANREIYYRLMDSNTDVTVFHPSPRIVLKSVYGRIKVNVTGLGTRPEKITLGCKGYATSPTFDVRSGSYGGSSSTDETLLDYMSASDIVWTTSEPSGPYIIMLNKASIDRLIPPLQGNGVLTRLIITVPEGIAWEVPLAGLNIKMDAGATYTINVEVGKSGNWNIDKCSTDEGHANQVNAYDEQYGSYFKL